MKAISAKLKLLNVFICILKNGFNAEIRTSVVQEKNNGGSHFIGKKNVLVVRPGALTDLHLLLPWFSLLCLFVFGPFQNFFLAAFLINLLTTVFFIIREQLSGSVSEYFVRNMEHNRRGPFWFSVFFNDPCQPFGPMEKTFFFPIRWFLQLFCCMKVSFREEFELHQDHRSISSVCMNAIRQHNLKSMTKKTTRTFL
jgi:hypothetical protein